MSEFWSIEDLLENAVAQGISPGLSLAFGRADQPMYNGFFGQAAHTPQARALKADTLFDLASLTKTLGTTLLCLQARAAGRLDLDDTLDKLRPGHYPPDKAPLTLRDLMCHCAGFPAHVPYFSGLSPQALPPRHTTLARILSTPLAHAPRTHTQYSDLGPILVGDLLEYLHGERLDRLFDRDLAAPLGLRDTFFICADTPLKKARRPATAFAATETCSWRGSTLQGQVHDENAFLLHGVAGHAGLFSTSADLVLFARHLLRAAEGDDTLGLAAGIGQCAKHQRITPDSPRSFGWEMARPGASCGARSSAKAFGHTGFTGTSLWLDLERQAYIILLSNRVHPTRANTAFVRFRPQVHDAVFAALDAA